MNAQPGNLTRTRVLFALLLWAGVAAILWIVVEGDRAPTATDAVVATASRFLGNALLGAGVVLALGVLAWPPFLPSLRLAWRKLREQTRVDQRPMHDALARLAHFDNAADHLTVGRTLFRMGNARNALPHLAKSIELDPQSAAAHFFAGQALAKLGQLPLACEQLSLAVQIEPDHGFGDAILLLGTTLARADRGDAAESVLAQHEARFGSVRRADVVRAKLALARGDREAAARFVARAARPMEKSPMVNPEELLARAQARVMAMRLGVKS
ncbi:MAG: tetratricopeptide repeat protein [Planctomycetota bacterium]